MPSSFNCPNCSAPLDLTGDSVAIRCPYCNSSVILPEALSSLRADAPTSPTLNFGPLLSQASALSEIARFIRAGNKIEAIKVYRQAFGGGLKEAKDAIDALAAGRSIHFPAVVQPPAAAQAGRAATLKEIAAVVETGNKIEAIKMYRATFGVGLKEAKDAVEAIETGQMDSGWVVPSLPFARRVMEPPARPLQSNTLGSLLGPWAVLLFITFWIAFFMVMVGAIFIPDSVRLAAPALCPKGYKGAYGEFFGYYRTDNFEGTNVVILRCLDVEYQQVTPPPFLTDVVLCGGYWLVGGLFAFLLLVMRRARGTPWVWLWRLAALAALGALVVGARIYLDSIPAAKAQAIVNRLSPTAAPTEAPAPAAPAPPSLPYFGVRSFGSEGTGPGAFDDSRAIAVDGAGNIYVGDYSGGRIQVFDSEGGFTTQWRVSGDAKDIYLLGLAVDRAGTVYASRGGNIYLHDGATDELLGQIENPDNLYFDDIALTADGGLIAATDNGGLTLIDPAGKIVWSVPDALAGAAGESDSIADLATDGRDNIYVVGLFSRAVYKFSPQGNFSDKIAGEGDKPGQLSSPRAIAIDIQGRMFIADFNGIQAFDADGFYLGMIESEDASIFNMTFDGSGNLFVMARNSAKVIQFVLNR